MFGDGSDGTLNVTSGTRNLPLNVKHQFESVYIGAGATLSTNSTTGAVLYITATNEIVIDGSINVSGKVSPGRRDWAVTINGEAYTSPGVPNARYYAGQSAENFGFGAGGAGRGATFEGTSYTGGDASTGGFSPNGGAARTVARTSNGISSGRNHGAGGNGGSGVALAILRLSSGSRTVTATGGAGGQAYGADGLSGSGSISGEAGGGAYGWVGGGGGGAGGIAGRAGVHVVLRAPKVTINGTINTSGTAGGKGGDGGRSRDTSGWRGVYGDPGAGGAGGNGGDLRVIYADSYTRVVAGTITAGGAGGASGAGREDKSFTLQDSPSGSTGHIVVSRITDPSQYSRTLTTPTPATSTQVFAPAVLVAPLVLVPPTLPPTATYYGGKVTMAIRGAAPAASALATFAPSVTQTPPPPPPPTDWSVIGKEDKKVYVYRVYEADGTYVGTWDGEVEDDPEFTQHINSPGTTMTVQLARSANSMRETRSVRVTEDGHERIAESGHKRINLSMTPNTVGEGTDVELNHNVDIYAHYGEFRTRITEHNRVRVTEDGHERITASGAPQGVRIFSGFILDYDSEYAADNSGVTVTLASHGYELSHALIKDGSKTTANYPTQPIETTIKSLLDTNPGVMTYDIGTIDDTGVSVPAKFQLNTKLEGIQYLVEQAADGWYWFGHVGDNHLYVKQVSNEPDHTFVKGKHIKSLRLKRSLENLVNEVYFVGGETTPGNPASVLYRRYANPTSQTNWRVGLHRRTDRRYTLSTSTQRYADKLLNENGAPAFTTPLVISSARYNIETIKLGQTVAFRNFGNFIDDVVLQIVSLKYTPTAVTVELGTLLERQVDTLSKVEAALDNEQFESIPDTPS